MKKVIYSLGLLLAVCLAACSGNEGNTETYLAKNEGSNCSSIEIKSPAYRGSCNLRSHRCRIYVDRNGDNLCDDCAASGYRCHAVNHQVVN